VKGDPPEALGQHCFPRSKKKKPPLLLVEEGSQRAQRRGKLLATANRGAAPALPASLTILRNGWTRKGK